MLRSKYKLLKNKCQKEGQAKVASGKWTERLWIQRHIYPLHKFAKVDLEAKLQNVTLLSQIFPQKVLFTIRQMTLLM